MRILRSRLDATEANRLAGGCHCWGFEGHQTSGNPAVCFMREGQKEEVFSAGTQVGLNSLGGEIWISGGEATPFVSR